MNPSDTASENRDVDLLRFENIFFIYLISCIHTN